MAEKELKQMLVEYEEKITNQAENLIADHFPKKILELDILHNSSQFSIINLPAIRRHPEISRNDVPPPSIWRKLLDYVLGYQIKDDGSKDSKDDMPSNNLIVPMVDQLKPHIQELVDSTNVLKSWIMLLKPNIEDGNNFGVEIQKNTLAVIESIKVDASSYLKKISKYFLDRGDIVTRIEYDPYVEDYKRALMELDEEEFLRILHTVVDLRNHYKNLHNCITMNLEKIKKPKTLNSENLY